MKILTETGIYIQMQDLYYLEATNLKIPMTIFSKSFGSNLVFQDNMSKYKFIKFTRISDVDFLNQLNFLIDYNTLKTLTDKELNIYLNKIKEKRDVIIKRINSMNKWEKMKNQKIIDERNDLDYKINSLYDYILYRNGKLFYKLPKEVRKNEYKKKIKTLKNK